MDGRSLLKLIQGQQEQWRPYIDMEHATCYSDDNYWAALTDGKIKYIWNFHNGSEQLFDLRENPGETHNLSEDAAYQNKLSELRKMMVEHLSERGDSFVKDGKLMTLDTTLLYSSQFPEIRDERASSLQYLTFFYLFFYRGMDVSLPEKLEETQLNARNR